MNSLPRDWVLNLPRGKQLKNFSNKHSVQIYQKRRKEKSLQSEWSNRLIGMGIMIHHCRHLHDRGEIEEVTKPFQVWVIRYDISYVTYVLITIYVLICKHFVYSFVYTVVDMNAQQRQKYEQATERHNKRLANKQANPNDMDWKWLMKPFKMLWPHLKCNSSNFSMWILIVYGFVII